MDYVGGPRDEGGEDAQRLHKRIERYAKAEESIGPQLMALKWLGNTGSHSGDVGQQELLDAFEILEHVLAEIVERRSDRVAALARELTEKHGK